MGLEHCCVEAQCSQVALQGTILPQGLHEIREHSLHVAYNSTL